MLNIQTNTVLEKRNSHVRLLTEKPSVLLHNAATFKLLVYRQSTQETSQCCIWWSLLFEWLWMVFIVHPADMTFFMKVELQYEVWSFCMSNDSCHRPFLICDCKQRQRHCWLQKLTLQLSKITQFKCRCCSLTSLKASQYKIVVTTSQWVNMMFLGGRGKTGDKHTQHTFANSFVGLYFKNVWIKYKLEYVHLLTLWDWECYNGNQISQHKPDINCL